MLRDQQLTGSPRSEQLDSCENRSTNNRMQSIHSDGVDRVEIWQRVAIRPLRSQRGS